MSTTGLETVLRNLDKASGTVQNAASRRAAVEAARVIARQARSNAHRVSGTLRRSLVAAYSRKRSQKNVVQVALVRARAGIKYRPKERVTRKGKHTSTKNADAYYAGWVEFGHKVVGRFKGKYEDYPVRGRGRLTGLATRRRASKTKVRPYPYLAPAFQSHGRQALKALEDSLRSSLKNAS